MDNFIYHIPTKVYFGKGQEENVGKIVAEYQPKKVLLHYGSASAKQSGLLARIENLLTKEGICFVKLGGVRPNPEIGLVRRGVALCLEQGVDFVLAVGGGSVLDSAKAIANGAANPEIDAWAFSSGAEIPKKTLPKGAVLTLAAAGSEMSDSCVISNPETGEKRGYSNALNRMNFAIENPELSFTVSPYQTACGAVDIAMHTIERYFCPAQNTEITDALSEAIIKTAFEAGLASIKNPTDYAARANMMWTSSLAHNGLTQCGKSFQLVVHQFEHVLSGLYPEIAHGAGLAALWCSWARYASKFDTARFLQYAQNVWGLTADLKHPEKTINEAINLQEEYYKKIGMPTGLKAFGIKQTDFQEMALRCSNNKTRTLMGAKPLDYDDILAIYQMAYDND